MIRKTKQNTYCVDISQGRGRRHRKVLKSLNEAKSYQNYCLLEIAKNRAWVTLQSDKRSLKEMIDIWFNLHGKILNEGVDIKRCLFYVAKALGNPLAKDVNYNAWAKYRAKRLKTVYASTINNEQSYLNAIYNKLYQLGEIDYPSPISRVKKIKTSQRQLRFLSKNEIERLLKNISHQDTLQAAKLCLATGTRWGEVKNLQSDQIVGDMLYLRKTKNGKNRMIPIHKNLAENIKPPLKASDKKFKKALLEAGIALEKWQNTHILRHTYASHFIANGGNILTLQKILGHSSIKMTMTYAHLAPDYLKDAVTYSPMLSKYCQI